MEEQKKNKKVQMSVVKNEEKKPNEQKMSYDELNNVCAQLYQQNQNLIKQVQQLNISTMFKRLDYLFKVLEFNPVFNDKEFVTSCVNEIKEAMTVANDVNKQDSKEK